MVIKEAPPLWGIRFWAAWYDTRKPRYEVFRYHGQGSDGFHYFMSARSKEIVGFTEAQLLGPGTIRPFLINTKETNLATAS